MAKKINRSNRGCKGIDADALVLKLYFENPPAGLNNKDLARWLGIGETAFYDLKATNAKFSESLDFYLKISHLEVLKSFRKIACGFYYDEITRELKGGKMVITKKVKKYQPPNVNAAWHWLRNKMPDHFREKIFTEHSFDNGTLDRINFVFKTGE